MLSANGSAKRRRTLNWLKACSVTSSERLGDDAAAPVVLAEPVTDLRRKALDVGSANESDSAGGFVVDFDGQAGGPLRGHGRHGMSQERVRVRAGVRVGKLVAQMTRDVEVVRVPDE